MNKRFMPYSSFFMDITDIITQKHLVSQRKFPLLFSYACHELIEQDFKVIYAIGNLTTEFSSQ